VIDIPCPALVLLEFPEKTGQKWPQGISVVPDAYVMAFDINNTPPSYVLDVKTTTPGSSNITIRFNQFKFEIALVVTFYKLQGATLPALIVELNNRPGGIKSMDLRSLFVALSRVEDGDNFRIFPLEFPNSLDYLLNMKRDDSLDIWNKCFNADGKFIPPRPLESCNYVRPESRKQPSRSANSVVHPPRGRVRTRVDFEDAEGGEEETKGSELVGTTNTRLRRPMLVGGHGLFMLMLPMVFFLIFAISVKPVRITS
jgi:hypothetical protein